jgi:hypothetical protein
MSLEAAATDKMIHETIACGLPVISPDLTSVKA